MLRKKDKNIVIFGLGETGNSAIKYFLKEKNKIIAWDDNQIIRKKIKKKFSTIKIKNLKNVNWKEIYFVLVSPGISLKNELLKDLKKFNIPIYRDLEIFSQKVDSKKIISVTGTNGKSTTVSLIGNMILSNSKKVFIGGNLKHPLFDGLRHNSFSKYVIELSSFQLESAPSFNSYISILLNIHEDHTDRYKNLAIYTSQKKKIFKNLRSDQYAVIGIDDPRSFRIYNKIKNKSKNVIPISINKKLKKGIFFSNNQIIDNFFKKQKININKEEKKFSIKNNKQNILATYVVSKILNYNKNIFLKSIINFKPLKHRSEIIYNSRKLKIINDSKATNLSSVINSIKPYNGIHLIMGGKSKHKNYKELKFLRNRIRKIYLIGESSNYIYKQLKNTLNCEECKIMETALRKCFKDLKKFKNKSIILLAPGCSSFDQYKNFIERGKNFSNLSKKIFKGI